MEKTEAKLLKEIRDNTKQLKRIADKLDVIARMIANKSKADTPQIEAFKGDVVRCKECKYWTEELEFCQISEKFPIVTRADSYCSYGERRSDETD